MTPAARKARNLKVTSSITFYISAAVTVTANMYASQHTVIGLAIGLWTPVAFFLALELLERMPAKGMIGKVRMVAIAVLALIAGWESYWHLVHVLTDGGAGVVGRYAMPFTVDILMVIARMAMHAKAPATPARRKAAAKNVTPITRARKTA